MEFQTLVNVLPSAWKIGPCESMILVGSCFADEIGQRLRDDQFRVIVNPYGVMYNPVSIFHTLQKWVKSQADSYEGEQTEPSFHRFDPPRVAILTLGTNHVYVLKQTGEIVDNCQKRPAKLFEERELSVDECVESLRSSVKLLQSISTNIHIVFTVSPIRYRKYGYHESRLSKATLLLAADKVLGQERNVDYFPSYELLEDELRDYRFYQPDMIHPSAQAVDYIYQKFAQCYFSGDTFCFLKDWEPIKKAIAHKPFHPESDEYKQFVDKTQLKIASLCKKYPIFALSTANNEKK